MKKNKDTERVRILAERLNAYDKQLYSDLENYFVEKRKEATSTMDLVNSLVEAMQDLTPEQRAKVIASLGGKKAAAQPAQLQGQADHEAEQKRLRDNLEAELLRTKGYYQRGVVRDKYRKMGLGQAYQPPQEPSTPEQLEQAYRQELEAIPEGNREAVLQLRSKYRRLQAQAEQAPGTPEQFADCLGTGPQARLRDQYQREIQNTTDRDARLRIRDAYRKQGLEI